MNQPKKNMLKGPDGNRIDNQKEINQQKLRGERLNQIRKDMNNGELSDKEKLLKYSSHLEWFNQKWKALYAAMDFWMNPGKWNKTRYSHGFANGLIAGFAIFVEEQADPPFFKTPEEYEADDSRVISEQAKGFMINLSRQLECIICMGEDGRPKGYSDAESVSQAWLDWRNDTTRHLDEAPFEIPEIRMIVQRIQEFNQQLSEQNK